MKKIIAILLFSMLIMGASIASAEVNVKVIVDDEVIMAQSVIENNRTLVPAKDTMTSAGADIKWYGDTRKVEIIKAGKTITLTIDSNIMNTPDGDKVLDAVPRILSDNRTYLPIKAVCDELGMTVEWDGGTKTVLVFSNDASPYVDKYGGMTVEECAIMNEMTNEELASELLLDYKDIQGMKFTDAQMMTPVIQLANKIGYTEAKDNYIMYGVTMKEGMTIGEFEAQMSLGDYFEYIGAMSSYPSADAALISFREYYSLGKEYTLDTKMKFIRTIMDSYNYPQDEAEDETQTDLEKLSAEATSKLSELTERKIGFTITMEDGSVMNGELYPDLAPITVENFKKLANSGFYDGLVFHRVIDGFMIQGGGYDVNMQAKEANSIKGEFIQNGVANGLLHEKGVISMARTSLYNSASSQFFIMDETSPHLDGAYAAFGRICEGLDVVNKISEVETGTNGLGMTDVPIKPVVIKSIVVE